MKRWLWSKYPLKIPALLLDFYKNTNFSVWSMSPNKSIENLTVTYIIKGWRDGVQRSMFSPKLYKKDHLSATNQVPLWSWESRSPKEERSFECYSPKIGLPRWCCGKESFCQCRRRGFNHWVGKILWRSKWEPIPVFLSGESHPMDREVWRATVHGVAKSWTWQSNWAHRHTSKIIWTKIYLSLYF